MVVFWHKGASIPFCEKVAFWHTQRLFSPRGRRKIGTTTPCMPQMLDCAYMADITDPRGKPLLRGSPPPVQAGATGVAITDFIQDYPPGNRGHVGGTPSSARVGFETTDQGRIDRGLLKNWPRRHDARWLGCESKWWSISLGRKPSPSLRKRPAGEGGALCRRKETRSSAYHPIGARQAGRLANRLSWWRSNSASFARKSRRTGHAPLTRRS